METWADLTADEVDRSCSVGRLIVAGPLNDTYSAVMRGIGVFVRVRTVRDCEYGQTFAGERQAYPLIGPGLRVPRLLGLLDAKTGPAAAVFELIPEAPVDWTRCDHLVELARMLSIVHAVPGIRLGTVGDESEKTPMCWPIWTNSSLGS